MSFTYTQSHMGTDFTYKAHSICKHMTCRGAKCRVNAGISFDFQHKIELNVLCVCFSTNHDWLFAVWLFWRSSPHSWVCRTSGWLWTWTECWPALTSPNRSDLQTPISNGFNYLLKGENVLCFLATSSNKVTVKVFSRWTWCVRSLGTPGFAQAIDLLNTHIQTSISKCSSWCSRSRFWPLYKNSCKECQYKYTFY